MPEQEKNQLKPNEIAKQLKMFDKEFDGAEEADLFAGFTPLEEGDYLLGVQDFDWFESQNKNIGIKVKFVAIEEKNSPTVFHNFMITENNMPFLKRDLQLMGIKINKLSDLQGIDFMEYAAKAHIGQRTYNDKIYNEIRWFMEMTTEERLKVLSTDINKEEIPEGDDSIPF